MRACASATTRSSAVSTNPHQIISSCATADPEDVGAGTYHVKGVSSSTLGEPSVATGPVAMAVNDTRGDPDFARNSGVMMFNRKQATASHRLDSK